MDNKKKYNDIAGEFLLHCARMTSTIEEMAAEIERLQKALAEREKAFQEMTAKMVQKEATILQHERTIAELMRNASVQVTNNFYDRVGNAVGNADNMMTSYEQETTA